MLRTVLRLRNLLKLYSRPLLPGSCHAAELKFLPLATGALHVDAIRVVDVLTSEAIDVKDLPDIIAVEA